MVRSVVLGTTLLCLAACTREVPLVTLSPTISVLPESLDFTAAVAADQMGAEPANQEILTDVFVENIGRADLTYTMTLDEPDFAMLDPETSEPVTTFTGMLAPGDDQQLTFRFTPQMLGEVSASVLVESNDLERQSFELPLSGVGRVPFAPDIDIVPRSFDFGTVELDDDAQDVLTILNLGDAPLALGSVGQLGAGTFRIDPDPSGTELLPGASLTVLVNFDPVQPGGDSGVLVVRSNDADEPAIEVTLQANGGGKFDYPEAVITGCPETADVTEPVRVELSGIDSVDPDGGELTYEWSLIRPTEDDAEDVLDSTTGANTSFELDSADVWEIGLVVTNEAGRPSVPAKCIIDATPIDDIFVQLSWAGPTSDLDLHLAQEGAPFFDVPGDVSYCNPSPDWGVQGDSSDDPLLARDDDDGLGPEVITLSAAPAGAYLVRVHHFDDGDDGTVTATVVVYADGKRITEQSEILARNEVWDVGQINWPDRTFGTSTAPPYDAGGTRECKP